MNSLEQLGLDGDPRHYDLLLELADLMVLHLTLPELLAELAGRLHKAICFDTGNFALHDAAKSVMRVHVWEGRDFALPSQVPIDDSASGWVWKNQLPLVMADLDAESRFPTVSGALRERGIHSYCMLPLTTSQTRFGAMGLGSSKVDAYQKTDLRLLQRVTKLVALALENSFDRETLVREKNALSTLLDLNATLTSSLDVQQLFPLIAGFLEKIIGPLHVSVTLEGTGPKSMKMYSLEGSSSKCAIGMVPIRDCAAYQAIQEGQPRIFRRRELEGTETDVTGGMVAKGVRSAICI